MKSYYCYLLKCHDGTIYVGATSNLEKRLAEHQHGAYATCYTYRRRPVALAWQEQFAEAEDMIAAERKLKGWSNPKKQALIEGQFSLLPSLSKKKFV